MKFINIKAIVIVCATIILPQGLTAETIIMDCEGTYFKYSKSFWSEAKVTVRKDADWEPWCAEGIKVTDAGAICGFVVEEEIGKKVYEYAYVDKNYIDHSLKELSKRHSFCKLDNTNKLCKARAWAERIFTFAPKNSGSKLYENTYKKPKPSWSFGCNSGPIGPNFESNFFYKLPLSIYQKRHSPKMGEQMCSTSSNFVVSEIKKNSVTDTLDFLLLVQKLGPISVKHTVQRVDCNRVE